MVSWDLKAQRSVNGSILLLWHPAKWRQLPVDFIYIKPMTYRDKWSEHQFHHLLGSLITACTVFVMVPPLHLIYAHIHTSWYNWSPSWWSWAAFLTLGLNVQGKAVRVRTGNKNMNQVKLLWDPLAFVFSMNYMSKWYMFVGQPTLPQNSLWHNFTTTNKPIYLAHISKFYSFKFLNEAVLHQMAYSSVTQQWHFIGDCLLCQ